MTPIFLLIDQHKNYLGKDGLWHSTEEAQSLPNTLYRTTMKDEAINQKVEYVVKNPDLRIAIETATLNEQGKLLIDTRPHDKDETSSNSVDAHESPTTDLFAQAAVKEDSVVNEALPEAADEEEEVMTEKVERNEIPVAEPLMHAVVEHAPILNDAPSKEADRANIASTEAEASTNKTPEDTTVEEICA